MSAPCENGQSTAGDHEVTRALQAAQTGDKQAADALLEMVYDELRKLAKVRMDGEAKGGVGSTLQATALVHEAYVRLVAAPADDPERKPPTWQDGGISSEPLHWPMRRILVERARHRQRMKHGGGRQRVELSVDAAVPRSEHELTDLMSLDEALKKLAEFDPRKEKVVMLRYFGGLSVEETAAALDLSPATVKNEWTFARRGFTGR